MSQENNSGESKTEKVKDFANKAISKTVSFIMILIILALVGVVFYFWHQNELLKQENETLKTMGGEVVKKEVEEKVQNKVETKIENVQGQVQQNNQDLKQQVAINNVQNQQGNNLNNAQNNQVPSNWKFYKNDELGISFSYPNEWGEVIEKQSVIEGWSEKFMFSNLEYGGFGGMYNSYWEKDLPGRHGSMLDFTGFANNYLISYGDKKTGGEGMWKEYKYKTNFAHNCAYSVEHYWFPPDREYYDSDGLAYHAVCNLKNDKMSGFNFSFGGNINPVEVEKEDFVKMIESVQVY